MKLLLTIIGMLLVLFIITFSLANFDPVHLKYYDLFDFKIPAYLLIFIAFGAGRFLWASWISSKEAACRER